MGAITDDARRAARFEEHRGRLRAIAYRILGSPDDADDAVQEAWIRYDRTDTDDVANLGSWLTTVVSRVCLNLLEARRSRPQPSLRADPPETIARTPESDPEHEALLADSIGHALQVVLDTLTPAERVAFVLHDIFTVPFDDVAPIVDRNAATTRKLASRARVRVSERGAALQVDRVRQAMVVDAFLTAARNADFEALLAVLDPDAELHADDRVITLGAKSFTRGAAKVAEFGRYAKGATPVLIDDVPAMAWYVGGRARVVYTFTVVADRITAIELIGDPDRIAKLDPVAIGH
ncbi:sigma-70 family RNA polymerase sigma factor [Solicola gregarius]|uniref:Sigma-70 family RNA polymerase sigma factor n=1 Tax=Solicola gregarius TaxID=2908642 RepID=A0AA46YN97_9ACTN|nr:sigma-70 family RNA polymerase sigma factor [Solicola gregarius]UYM07379.1 sigma-70 family RNA polymerase sigma factor [Solicola gregarius]